MEAVTTIDFSQLRFAGQLAHWVAAALLLVFFLTLPRFGAQRRLMPTWIAAWSALLVATTVPGLSALGALLGRPLVPDAVGILFDYLGFPAQVLFVLLVTLAAVQASGKRFTPSLIQSVVIGGALLALAGGVVDEFALAKRFMLLAMPLLFVGAAQLLFAAARGQRTRGMTFLAATMVIFAAVTTLFQVAPTTVFHRLAGDWLADRIASGHDFGMAVLVALLGAAVVVLVVQDSVLLAATAQEERLREVGASEDRLKRIIEAAGEAIVTVDPARRVVLANAAAGRLFRLPPAALVGRDLGRLVVPEGEPLTTAAAGQDGVLLAAGAWTGTGIRPNGTRFPAEVTTGPLPGDDGPAGGVAILRDLTTQLEAAAEREAFERQMAASEKMLAIGRVVSGVAHELNNPLTVVLGQSEQLSQVAVDLDARESIRLINEQAQRARHIVRDLLAFVRPGEDPGEPVHLTDLVQRVVTVQRPRAAERGVSLRVEPGPEPVGVLANRIGMEQVVTNLLENGIDAAGPGGTVTVRLGTHAERGLVMVEDTGPGVDPLHQDRIFEPFFTTKKLGLGTGLGLPVSRALVERHDGTLVLENRPAPGIGARMVVTLERCALPDPPEPQPEAPVRCPPVRRRDTDDLLPVLIVDDESAVRTTIGRIFHFWEWPVLEVDSGEAAIALLAQTNPAAWPSVILCDLRMPGMGGQGLHAELVARFPALLDRLIFVTGDVVEPSTAAFLRSAGRPVVEKPFTIAEAAAVVSRMTSPH